MLDLSSRLELFQVIYGSESGRWGSLGASDSHDSSGAFDVKGFDAFRRRSLIEVGEKLASEGNLRALTVLLTKHPVGSGPRRGLILRRLPETMPPATYQHLLPFLGEGTGGGAGPLDWAHSDRVRQQVTRSVDLKAEHWDRQSLVAWYLSRVIELEASGAPICFAVELCEIGLVRTFPERAISAPGTMDPSLHQLTNLHRDLWHLSRLVYAGLLPDCFSLADWSSIKLPSMVKTILETAPLDSLVDTINAHILPLLRGQLALCDEGHADLILEREVNVFLAGRLQAIKSAAGIEEDEAMARALQACVEVAQASKPTISQKDRLIRREVGLVCCVMSWCYAYDGVLEISRLWDMFECLPIKIQEGGDQEDIIALQKQLDDFEALLTVADTLLKYGIISIPLTTFRDLGPKPSHRPEGWTFRDIMAVGSEDAHVPLTITVIKMLADRLSTAGGGEWLPN